MKNHGLGVGVSVALLVSASFYVGCKNNNVNVASSGGAEGGASSDDTNEGAAGKKVSGAAGTGASTNEPAGPEGGTESGGNGSASTGGGDAGAYGVAGDGSVAGDTTEPLCAKCACVQSIESRYVIRTDGALLSMGSDGKTQMAVLDDKNKPLKTVVHAAGGREESFGCAALADGSAWCWPESRYGNDAGQLGSGSTEKAGSLFKASPVMIDPETPLTGVVGVSAGRDDACATLENGGLYCWGNVRWLVAGGESRNSEYAIEITTDGVAPIKGVLAVALSDEYATSSAACALVEQGVGNEVWCWGFGRTYGLGDGTDDDQQYPNGSKSKAGLSEPTGVRIAQPSNTGATGCAIDGDSVRCWGYNIRGSVGSGVLQGHSMNPTPVVRADDSPLPAPLALSHSGTDVWCALESDKKLWCWGDMSTPEPAAADYGVTNVIGLGDLVESNAQPRYLTNDGMYHVGSKLSLKPKCGAL